MTRLLAGFVFCISIVLTIPLLPQPGDTGSLCSAQPEPQGSVQCPRCGAWNAMVNGHLPSRCSCGYSFSGDNGNSGGGGGYSGGGEERGPTAMDQALDDINEFEQKLGPVRQQKQAKRDEIEKLRKELADLRKQVAEARQAAADAKARKDRQQQALAALEATQTQWQRQFEQRLSDLQNSLAQIEALRHGGRVSVHASMGDYQSPPPPVYLDEQDLYKQIDPSAFLTPDIYRQALKERDRQTALAEDLKGRLAQMDRWRRSQTNISAEFAALQRNETTGLMGDVLDLAAPVEVWLEGAKVSRVVLTRYKVAYASMKTAVAAYETAKAGTQDERDAKLQSATASFLDATTAICAAGVDPATGKHLADAAKAYDIMTKTALAATTEEREAKVRLYVDAVATLNPYATAAKAACNLTERGLRYYQLTKTLDALADQKHTTELLHRRLKDKIDSLDVNSKESQRIIDLWEATHPKGEGAR